MPGKKLVSERQWKILLAFMTEYPVCAMGSGFNENSLSRTEYWRDLTSRLNSVGDGCIKSTTKWREYWNNAKYSARKKACARIQQVCGSDDAKPPKRVIQLTDKEEQILAILKKIDKNGEDDDMKASVEELYLPPASSFTTKLSPHPSMSPPPASPSSPLPASPVSVAPAEPSVLKRRDSDASSAPEWVLQLEERRIAVEERTARAFEAIAAGLAGIQATLEAMRKDAR